MQGTGHVQGRRPDGVRCGGEGVHVRGGREAVPGRHVRAAWDRRAIARQ